MSNRHRTRFAHEHWILVADVVIAVILISLS